jgi:hypothetical protein
MDAGGLSTAMRRKLKHFKMKWPTLTHAQRWRAHRHTAGTGARYGARFKSFPVREDWYFLKVCRYVERNTLLQINRFPTLFSGFRPFFLAE